MVPTPPPIIQVPVVDMESLDSGNVYSKPVLVEILLLRRVIRKSFGGAVVEYRVSEMELHRTSGTQTSNQIAIKVGVLKSFPLLNAGPRGMVEVRCQLVPTTVVAGQLVFVW